MGFFLFNHQNYFMVQHGESFKYQVKKVDFILSGCTGGELVTLLLRKSVTIDSIRNLGFLFSEKNDAQ